MNESATQTHAALATLEYEDNVLLWGGRKVTEIAGQIDRTPFYAYDKERISRRVAELRSAMPKDLKLHYAMKANPMPEVVEYMTGLVDGLDVASAGELAIALKSGLNPRDVSFAGPGKQDWELKEAIKAGITVNLESEGEMRRLTELANRTGFRPNVAIRVNPRFELMSAGMKMGGKPSPFGVDAERVPVMLSEIEQLNLNFLGFQVYPGSQNLRVDALQVAIAKTVELVIELAEKTDLNVSFVNIGGGLGIPYFPLERPFILSGIGDAANRAYQDLQTAFDRPKVIMELGRYLVGEAGIYVCRVIDIKESRGVRYAVTDGGLHHHLAASGNFGQVLRKNYPVIAVEKCGNQQQVTVVGPLCTPLDILGDRVIVDQLAPGSLVGILQSGAYGKTASPGAFLSHPECLEVLV